MSDDQDTSREHEGAAAGAEAAHVMRGGGHGFGISSETLEAASKVMGRLSRRIPQPVPHDDKGH